RWGTDILIWDSWVDGGVDVVVDNLGHIYTSHYISFGTDHRILIHRSTDEGDTWTLFDEVNITAPIKQVQLVSIHGTGDNYLLAYFLTDTDTFQALRWNTTAGSAFAAAVVSTDVLEFAVDRNYPGNTSSQRVFGIYKKSTDDYVRSARSTAGSYGFDWVDESGTLILGNMIDFAYGRDGAGYAVLIGDGTSNLRSAVNSNFNDPASWT